jgi:formamidopyrimidine-DNA glycosylase
MPELPEVEVARRLLERWAGGRQVRRVRVRERRVLAAGGPPPGRLVGARFARFDRKGKHLLITLRKAGQPLGLWSHLGMTGKWLRREPGDQAPRFSRVELELGGGATLHYADLRLFGKLRVVPGAAFDQLPAVAALGPDPLHDGVDPRRLAERFARSRKAIKPLLLDQQLLAGVGNIQASEALFRARIDPRRPARGLTAAELRRLVAGIRAAIDDEIAALWQDTGGGGKDIRYVEEPAGPNPFLVYGRAGERCPRCRRGTITRVVQAARSTFFCPRCQK